MLDPKVHKRTLEELEELKQEVNLEAKNIDDMFGLEQDKRSFTKSKYAVDYITMEHGLVNNVLLAVPKLQELIEEGNDIIQTYFEFNYDLFLSLYLSNPVIKHESEMDKTFILNHGLINAVVDLPEFEELTDYCVLDIFNSAISSIELHQKAIEMLKQLKEDIEDQGGDSIFDAINEAVEAGKQSDKLENELEAMEEIEAELGKLPAEMQVLQDELKMSLEEAKEFLKNKEQTMEETLEQNEDQVEAVKEIFEQAIRDIPETISEVTEELQQWGFDSGDKNVRIPIESKLEAIDIMKNSHKLKEFSDIVGKMREVAKKEQKQKNINGVSDIVGIDTGSRLSFVLPSEKMLLNNPITKQDFYKRLLENNLLQYELNSYETKGRGPMITCLDVSGSMGYDQERWAKATAIALIDVAQRQKRNYAYISFDDKLEDEIIIEKGYLDPATIVNVMENQQNGATDFEAPLKRAIELLSDSRFKNGDITFITDGHCAVSDSFLREYKKIKQQKEFVCRGILINLGRNVSTASLDEFCDEVLVLTDFVDLEAEGMIAKKIFREI